MSCTFDWRRVHSHNFSGCSSLDSLERWFSTFGYPCTPLTNFENFHVTLDGPNNLLFFWRRRKLESLSKWFARTNQKRIVLFYCDGAADPVDIIGLVVNTYTYKKHNAIHGSEINRLVCKINRVIIKRSHHVKRRFFLLMKAKHYRTRSKETKTTKHNEIIYIYIINRTFSGRYMLSRTARTLICI